MPQWLGAEDGRTRSPDFLFEAILKAEVSKDLPHTRPHADARANFGKLRGRLVDVEFDIRAVLL